MEDPSRASTSSSSPNAIQRQQQQVSGAENNSLTTSNLSAATSKYIRDFESLFVPIHVDRLRNQAQNGNLRHCQFRSICWRYFLSCLPERYDDWIKACKENRDKYIKIRDKNMNMLKSTAIQSDKSNNYRVQHKTTAQDQFRTSDSSLGHDRATKEYGSNKTECDYKNIYKTIERDVIRTFPGMEFFRLTEMQDILTNILFNFASENSHLSYKQGMHELSATLLYVAHTDSQNCLINYEGGYANEKIATLLDLKYLEHDVFHMFSALMKSIECWYQNDEVLIIPESKTSPLQNDRRLNAVYKRASSSIQSRLSSTPKHQVSSVLGLKLKKISENLVRRYDLELFNHLEALQIAPQIYGIRWMRLLFGREYEFLDLLTVWDAIICDYNSMSLVDYVFASMLMTIREELINGDYTDCLNNLMRHQFKNVSYVIRLALHLRNQVKEREIRGTQATIAGTQASSSSIFKSNSTNQDIPLVQLSTQSSGSFDVSSDDSYKDLHSIVDYCWRLLSEQIDSLQRCLPKEKSLHSEDEIFVALAQLKKVRDVLKGSLRLEDELETNSVTTTMAGLTRRGVGR